MEDDTDDPGAEKQRAPLDAFADVELGGLPPIAPDGGFMASGIGDAPVVPAAKPEHFMCLRGPCRYYWEVETFFASGNPSSTWDAEDGLKDPDTGEPVRMPRSINRSCTAHQGTEMQLTDDVVYECNRWDPLTPRELKRRAARRSKYLKLHPDHR